MKKHLVRATGLLGGLLMAAGCASPPPAPAVTAADLGIYEGPDRLQKLIEGAKKAAHVVAEKAADVAEAISDGERCRRLVLRR